MNDTTKTDIDTVEAMIDQQDVIEDRYNQVWIVTSNVGSNGMVQTKSGEEEEDLRHQTNSFYIGDLDHTATTNGFHGKRNDWKEVR